MRHQRHMVTPAPSRRLMAVARKLICFLPKASVKTSSDPRNDQRVMPNRSPKQPCICTVAGASDVRGDDRLARHSRLSGLVTRH